MVRTVGRVRLVGTVGRVRLVGTVGRVGAVGTVSRVSEISRGGLRIDADRGYAALVSTYCRASRTTGVIRLIPRRRHYRPGRILAGWRVAKAEIACGCDDGEQTGQ